MEDMSIYYSIFIREELVKYVEQRGFKPNTIVLPDFMYNRLNVNNFSLHDTDKIIQIYGMNIIVADNITEILFLNLI